MGDASQLGNVVTETGTWMITPMTVATFVSGDAACGEKTVVWKIANVADYLKMSNEELLEKCLTFDAGYCVLLDGTRTPATWQYYFLHLENEMDENKESGWIGVILDLALEEEMQSAKAWHSVSFSSGGNAIPAYTTTCEDFVNPELENKTLFTKSGILDLTKETNTLEVTLRIKVFPVPDHRFQPVLQGNPSSPSVVMQMKEKMILDLRKLLETGVGADAEIKVPSEVKGEVDESSYSKKVHKGILMARSPVFATMFAEEGEMVEAQEGKVVIKDMSPKGLDIFLHYLYSGEVLDDWLQVPDQILHAAEKYDLGALKEYCSKYLEAAVSTSNALELFKVAKLHNLSSAMSAIEEFLRINITAVLNNGPDSDDSGEENGERDEADEEEAA